MQESVGVETKPIQLVTKILLTMDHHISTAFGGSKEFCGGRRSMLAEKDQGNVFSVKMFRDSSCMILK